MTNKKSSNNKKNIIIAICSVLIVAIAVIIIITTANPNKKIDDSYFVSDGTKYVLSIDYSDIANETEVDEDDDMYMPSKIHEVYTYSGDVITGLKHYYEYSDEKSAKEAFDFIKNESSEKGISIDGKYIIAIADESEYSEYTASDIKETIELYQESINGEN